MEFKQSYYSYPQFFQTYLNFEKQQRNVKPINPLNTNSLNPQNIKPNKYNSLSYNPMSDCIDNLNNPSKGIPHVDYLPREYPPYYGQYETRTSTFTHKQFFTKSN